MPIATFIGALQEGIQSSHKDQFVPRSFIVIEVGNTFTASNSEVTRGCVHSEAATSMSPVSPPRTFYANRSKYTFTSISSYLLLFAEMALYYYHLSFFFIFCTLFHRMDVP